MDPEKNIRGYGGDQPGIMRMLTRDVNQGSRGVQLGIQRTPTTDLE